MKTDNSSQNLMLTIEQVSQLTGVRKSTLRYWEKSFEEFLKPARTESNRREYTMEDLNLVKTIKRLLEEEHLTSEGVRLMLLKMYPPQGTEGSNKKGTDNNQGERGCSGPIPLHANTKH
jgi:DNA-binding transcriptional MerR regulator|uniref:MerR family transcriptional regulator n=1 Tax=Desulfobacca acetoxidans TaxID=60893 RepID=A0A7V6A1X4_9BACT